MTGFRVPMICHSAALGKQRVPVRHLSRSVKNQVTWITRSGSGSRQNANRDYFYQASVQTTSRPAIHSQTDSALNPCEDHDPIGGDDDRSGCRQPMHRASVRMNPSPIACHDWVHPVVVHVAVEHFRPEACGGKSQIVVVTKCFPSACRPRPGPDQHLRAIGERR